MNEEYEVYPGKPPDVFLQDFFQSKRITIEAFCKNERISLSDFKRMAEEIMTEWGLKDEIHPDYKESIRHLINHIRTKHHYEQRNNQSGTVRAFARPNQDADERMARIAQELLRQSSGRDKP